MGMEPSASCSANLVARCAFLLARVAEVLAADPVAHMVSDDAAKRRVSELSAAARTVSCLGTPTYRRACILAGHVVAAVMEAGANAVARFWLIEINATGRNQRSKHQTSGAKVRWICGASSFGIPALELRGKRTVLGFLDTAIAPLFFSCLGFVHYPYLVEGDATESKPLTRRAHMARQE